MSCFARSFDDLCLFQVDFPDLLESVVQAGHTLLLPDIRFINRFRLHQIATRFVFVIIYVVSDISYLIVYVVIQLIGKDLWDSMLKLRVKYLRIIIWSKLNCCYYGSFFSILLIYARYPLIALYLRSSIYNRELIGRQYLLGGLVFSHYTT